MIRASGPSRCSSASAWSTLVARSYSNGAGTCTCLLPPCRLPLPATLSACDGPVNPLLGVHLRARDRHHMTLGQLRSFATVARLGSVKAAALALGVSEPAVSEAVKALRNDLGDELFVRGGNGIVLTPGGQRLAGAAAEIVGIADQARRAVRESRGEAPLLRIAATTTVSEHVAGPLIDAFRRRTPHIEVTVEVEPAGSFGALLADRRADVVLGPRPAADTGGLESVPFLRYRLVVVAGREHRLAGAHGLAPGRPGHRALARRAVRRRPGHAGRRLPGRPPDHAARGPRLRQRCRRARRRRGRPGHHARRRAHGRRGAAPRGAGAPGRARDAGRGPLARDRADAPTGARRRRGRCCAS